MPKGKTIQIYLPEGNPQGIKVCDINTSFVKAILIPRLKVNKLKDSKEISKDLEKPGIYFLINELDDLNTFEIYIGESENLFDRITKHDNTPDKEWNKVICFLSDKGNINKAHCKFLEHHCYIESKEIDRVKVNNTNIPTPSSLTSQDRDLALYFFDDLKFLLGTLGYPAIFEKIRSATQKDFFYCKNKDADAKGSFLEEGGFVVYASSYANLEISTTTTNPSLIVMRERLIAEGILKQEGNKLVFTQDFVFGSPSTAAAIVIGHNANGWFYWKTLNGETLDQLKR